VCVDSSSRTRLKGRKYSRLYRPHFHFRRTSSSRIGKGIIFQLP
jgi:hypothetical protein